MQRRRLPALAGLLLVCPAFAQQAPPANAQPGIHLGLDQLKAQVHVTAGRRLRPASWPNGARVAVALSFDVDNMSPSLLRGDTAPGALSRGEYGAVDGLPRILRLLDKHKVPASFFIPAVSDALHPQMIRDILAGGRHEVGVHGWIHEILPTLNNEAEEQRLLDQAIAHLTKVMGKRPVGYRAPSWAFSPYTMGQVARAGFLYDSSLMASDDAYELLLDGKPTGVIELPIEWILDDYPVLNLPGGVLASPELVNQIFQSEFDMAYDEGGLFILTMHPHVTGHRSRAAGLEKLILHMKSRPGVWFATHEQVARYVRQQRGSVSTAMAQTTGSLGIFEGASDVGAPSHKGSVTYDGARKEYRVTGGGNNMWGGRDDFFFVWRKVTGDVVITANLKIITGGAPHRKAGLMLRKDLEPGAVYTDAVVHGSGLTALQWREKPDDVTRTIHFPVDGPTRLRLERRRNVVTLYAGKEGGELTEMGNTEVAPFSPLYAGLAVCAHDDAAETTAVFSDVTVEVRQPPAPASGKK